MFRRKDEAEVEEEILSMVEEGQDQGFIHEDEAEMISNILDFDDKAAHDIMTARNRMFVLEKDITVEQALRRGLESSYSRYPVIDGELDNIIGVLHLKDLMEAYLDGKGEEGCEKVMEAPMLIHPNYDISKLLRRMQKEKNHIAIVVDEYGQTDGLVTLEDIIEEIVGKIQDEHDDEEEEAHRTADEGYVVDGLISLVDLQDLLPELMLPEDVEIETLNGFLLYQLGHLPKEREKPLIDYGGYQFIPLRIENQMIRLVKILPVKKEKENVRTFQIRKHQA
ncbi:MAG: HlyC/CorC family transporter [Eubacterium sp.]|nr:HlyC/CorC family transporter [Eubacterium sp.]